MMRCGLCVSMRGSVALDGRFRIWERLEMFWRFKGRLTGP